MTLSLLLVGLVHQPARSCRQRAISRSHTVSVNRAYRKPRVSTRPPAAYVGSYGDRTVSVVAGELMVARGLRVPARLIPVGPDSFAPETDPGTRFSFTVGAAGRAESLRFVQRDGSTSVVPRDAAATPRS